MPGLPRISNFGSALVHYRTEYRQQPTMLDAFYFIEADIISPGERFIGDSDCQAAISDEVTADIDFELFAFDTSRPRNLLSRRRFAHRLRAATRPVLR